MKDFFAFRRMITPVLIQVVYWILTVVAVVVGFVLLLAGDGVAKRFLGLLILVIGPLVVRIYAEASILFFRMNQTLTEIKNNTERR